mgnify:CR=1 FL=1
MTPQEQEFVELCNIRAAQLTTFIGETALLQSDNELLHKIHYLLCRVEFYMENKNSESKPVGTT